MDKFFNDGVISDGDEEEKKDESGVDGWEYDFVLIMDLLFLCSVSWISARLIIVDTICPFNLSIVLKLSCRFDCDMFDWFFCLVCCWYFFLKKMIFYLYRSKLKFCEWKIELCVCIWKLVFSLQMPRVLPRNNE